MINLKALMEKRAEQQQIMENLLHTADTETRAMSEEEAAQFDAAEKEIRAIDETIAREERARKVEKKAVPSEAEERAADEERAFADYVMGKVPELRAGRAEHGHGKQWGHYPNQHCKPDHQGGQRPLPDLGKSDHLQREGYA